MDRLLVVEAAYLTDRCPPFSPGMTTMDRGSLRLPHPYARPGGHSLRIGGAKTPQACRKLGISENTYYRWRKEYGGLRVDQARRLKQLERENGRLKKLLAETMLDNAILKEVSSGNF